MRFVDTKRFQPILYGGDLPHKDDLFHISESDIPRKREERFKFIKDNYIDTDITWWTKQYNRCIHGYTVENAIEQGGDAIEDGVDAFWKEDNCYLPQYDLYFINKKVHISGRYYFFLNFWPIYGLIEGKNVKGVIRPRFLDHQFLLSRLWDMQIEQQKDLQLLKTRQLGISEMYSGGKLSYNYLFLPASQNIIVSGEQDDADHTFENCDRGLDLMINTQFYLDRSVSKLQTSPLIKSKYTSSWLRSLTARDKPQIISKFSPHEIYYEEIGKGKKGWSLDVAGFARSAIFTNNIKTGYQSLIGTSGNLEGGAYDLDQRFYNPEKHNILSFKNTFEPKDSCIGKRVGYFMPKWWFKLIDKDGNTLKKKSIESLLEERKHIAPEKLYIHITQEAIYASEALQVSSLGFFGDDRISALNRRRMEIKQNTEFQLERRGILKLKDNNKPISADNIEFEYKDDGWLNIIEEPVKDKNGSVYINLYRAGLDSYDYDVAQYSSSKGALYIKKGFLIGENLVNTYVAEIVERPTVNEGGAETFYYHTILACLWYRCKVNIEYSNLRIFQYYEDRGFQHLLFERPRLAFANKIIKSTLSNKYGTDKVLKPQGLAILADRLTNEFIANMYFYNQIESLAKFQYVPSDRKPYNCDITIATMECEIFDKEDELVIVRSESDVINKRRRLVYKKVNGRTIQQFI
jgi:hypothetical protein